MDQTHAANFANSLISWYEKPQLQQSFVLGSSTISTSDGAMFPLWRPMFGDSFWFKGLDLFPETALLSTADDQAKAFLAISMDYTSIDNRLRIVPSTGDSRLDAILNHADLAAGWIISTAAWSRQLEQAFIAEQEEEDT